MRYIRLTEKDKKTLNYLYVNHPKHYFRQRCQALLLSHDGIKVPEIAKVLKVRTRTIYEWMNRWEAKGIQGLSITDGRGRKSLSSKCDKSIEEKKEDTYSA